MPKRWPTSRVPSAARNVKVLPGAQTGYAVAPLPPKESSASVAARTTQTRFTLSQTRQAARSWSSRVAYSGAVGSSSCWKYA